MQVWICSLTMMKGKKTSCNLYKLMGETIMGKDSGEEYSNVKKVDHVYILKKA